MSPRHTDRAARAAVVVGMLATILPVPASAQRAAPEASLVSVGGQVGSLGGVTVRLPARTPASWTLLLGFDGAGEAVLGANRQVERRLPGSPLRAYVAPGAFVNAVRGRVGAGATVGVGIGFYRHRYDVYLTAVPTLPLVRPRGVRVDLASGLRYAF